MFAKTAAMLCKSCHVAFLAPACQVTCIVIAQCSSKFSSSDVVTCFLLSGGLVFLFPLTRFLSSPSPFSTRVCQGQVSPDECPLVFELSLYSKFLSRHTSSGTRLFHSVSMPNPQPESAAVGMSITANSPLSKKKRKESALACKGSLFMAWCTQLHGS